ncbi:MAG: cytochrome c biogenesis protein ResB [Paludibacteraceae bacterium]|nr:cytochrome c biogenesis protein ResB [Paludibacteraceae bacterium]
MKRGFIVGLAVIIAGLLLELASGPVVWTAMRWPANIVALGVFVALITGLGLLALPSVGDKNGMGAVNKAVRWLGSYQAAVPTMVYAVGLTTIMGLTRQVNDGRWINDMLTFWPFVLIYILMMLIVGLAIMKHTIMISNRLKRGYEANGHQDRSWLLRREIPFMLNHLGLFIALCCGTAGNPDIQRMKMICETDRAEWRATDEHYEEKGLPIVITLNRFIMEEYDDGSPKRVASEIQIVTKSGKKVETTVDVNKPYEIDGFKIYQYGYDQKAGKDSEYSILEIVRDPWLWAVYTGIVMMLAGAVSMIILGKTTKE